MTVSTDDLYWTAGFLQGENTGSFTADPFGIQAVHWDREPLEKLQHWFGGTITPYSKSRPIRKRGKPALEWALNGHRAAAVMRMVFPLMFPGGKSKSLPRSPNGNRCPCPAGSQRKNLCLD
jgi:hypothetical protein